MKPPLSARTAFPLEENRLSQALTARRARGEALVDLTLGNPTEARLGGDPRDVLALLADDRGRRYVPDPLGLPEARAAVSAHLATLGARVQPDELILTASTSEAYSFAFHVLCDPGDEVLIPAPSYPLLDWLGTLAGLVVRRYPLAYDGAWHIDLPALAAALGPRTRAVVVVSPNNPTGSYLSASELAALRSLLAPRGIALLADEVFAEYPLVPRPGRVVSVAGERELLTFAFAGLSKTRALPQLKLAWTAITGPGSDVVRERLALVADTFLSLATPVQLALPRILARDDLRAVVHERVRANLAMLRERLRGSAVTLLDVEGGWYGVLRLPETRDEEAWAMAFLDAGVLVHPGHFFDFPGGAYAIVSLLVHPDDLATGLRLLLTEVDGERSDPSRWLDDSLPAEQVRHQRGPPRLVRGSQPSAGVAMKVLVKQHPLTKTRSVVGAGIVPQRRTEALLVGQKQRHEPPGEIIRDVSQAELFARARGVLHEQAISVVAVKGVERLDQQKVHREPHRTAPVGVAPEHPAVTLRRLVSDHVLSAVDPEDVGLLEVAPRERTDAVR